MANPNTSSAQEQELEFVHKTVTSLLTRASTRGFTNDNSNTHSASRNADLLNALFESKTTRAAFLEQSFLFDRVRCERPLEFPPADDKVAEERHQRSAHLHCLSGVPILNVGRLRSTRTYPFACSTVYDMRGHTDRTRWGPFRKDGSLRVDWEKVEAIMVVLGYNIQSKRFVSKLFSDMWNTPFSGSWPQSYLPKPNLQAEPSSPELQDPYGVTGTWYRVSPLCASCIFSTSNTDMITGGMLPGLQRLLQLQLPHGRPVPGCSAPARH